ncbi:prestin-like isoform X2 [Bacillus rossius redtenbacheri]|uniref:prestin-like isoform X2 n=1 Tax=Bacillus rossius redtenbacheri TaxID=93214 RepID=UPI002FDE3701
MYKSTSITPSSSNESVADPSCRFRIERPIYEQEELNKVYDYNQTGRRFLSRACSLCPAWAPREAVLQRVPVLTWLRHYRWREDAVGDLVSGFTVAVMNIPQGMAYALLGNVPPIVGLYMAFFPVLVYFVFGTSRHISMGSFAVVCMLAGKTVATLSLDEEAPPASSGANHTSASAAGAGHSPVQVAAAVAFMVGLLQLLMHIFRLGVVCTLLSETLVNAFTSGAAVHVLTSQVKDLLGLSVSRHRGPFRIITPVVSKVSRVPVPIELIVVVTGTLVSSYTNITHEYGIVLVGNIPTGLPAPSLPPFSLLADVALDSLTITMVSYTITMSMALIFAQKLGYEVESNQELLALGAGNVVGSFFSCLPFCASLSRSLVQQTVGGRTQLASVVSCGILLLVMLWIGPFFEPLPRCVLASLIVVALKGMLLQVGKVPEFCRLSVLDGIVWLVTFFTVVLVDIDFGLLAGVVISLVSIFIQGMKPYTCLLGVIPDTDLYLDMNKYKRTQEVPGIKIFHYCGGLNFATRTHFRKELIRLVGVNPQAELQLLEKRARRRGMSPKDGIENVSFVEEDLARLNNLGGEERVQLKSLLLDFSALSYIDPSGVNTVKILEEEFQKLGIPVYLAGSSCPVYENLKKCGLLGEENCEERTSMKIFPTVHDAVMYIQMNENHQNFNTRT